MLRMFAGTKTSPVGWFAIGVLCALVGALKCCAQGKPMEDCKFAYAGFATSPGEKIQIAEVFKRAAVQLEMCGSPKGCVEAPVAQGTPVQIYRRQGGWSCGYVSGHDGAGPAWILDDALRIERYNENPPLSAWIGVWNGGEDHVRIRLGNKAGTLILVGNAIWQGKYTSHMGDTKGFAVPVGNHLHFVENVTGCTIDLVLLNRYILAEDNQACGGLNARFQGIWRRVRP